MRGKTANHRWAAENLKDFHEGTLLHCPVRGPLNVKSLAADGLSPSEEARRVDLIKYLLHREYPKENIAVETVVLKNLGEGGRNSLRADLIVFNCAAQFASSLPQDKRLQKALVVAEVKRDSAKKTSAISCQLKPALRQLPSNQVLGIYWDDISRLLFLKKIVRRNGDSFIEIQQDNLANLPSFGKSYKPKRITVDTLTAPQNLAGTLHGLANAMRSHGVYDEQLRYKETVKLLLARYCDEKEAKEKKHKEVFLQVYDGADSGFRNRVDKLYQQASRRYHRAKSLFGKNPESTLDDDTLKEVVKTIQGINLSLASNEAMQEVFMSFVPAIFKSSLDQYFTPITLVDTMVSMTEIGPTDRIADPAMGTADFLTAAMSYRQNKGDEDVHQRVFGIDSDSQAFELAVINMILNKDGQANLCHGDSIKDFKLWNGEIGVVLCNPPFGSRTVEKQWSVHANYELGHQWKKDSEGVWSNTGSLRKSQQLGVLFIERSIRMLSEGGRLAIIVPEGYLSTDSHGYIRQWILRNCQILSLVELPRRIFVKSDVDLRSNILVAEKHGKASLAEIIETDYLIHTALVRKIGYKMGKGFKAIPKCDQETGLEIRNANNEILLDSDFSGVVNGYRQFRDKVLGEETDQWPGARVSDILGHPLLDMKPRRLMPRALKNMQGITEGRHVRLREIASVLKEKTLILEDIGCSSFVRLVEGQDIRAVEGTAIPQEPERCWAVTERKSKNLYVLRDKDIIVGLVRPERRNIGMLRDPGEDIVGAPDGIAVVRIKSDSLITQEALFAILRSEACRLQFWTGSGGTSYGKLTQDQIEDVLIPVPSTEKLQEITSAVSSWSKSFEDTLHYWQAIGEESDRKPIVNSPTFGLEED